MCTCTELINKLSQSLNFPIESWTIQLFFLHVRWWDRTLEVCLDSVNSQRKIISLLWNQYNLYYCLLCPMRWMPLFARASKCAPQRSTKQWDNCWVHLPFYSRRRGDPIDVSHILFDFKSNCRTQTLKHLHSAFVWCAIWTRRTTQNDFIRDTFSTFFNIHLQNSSISQPNCFTVFYHWNWEKCITSLLLWCD